MRPPPLHETLDLSLWGHWDAPGVLPTVQVVSLLALPIQRHQGGVGVCPGTSSWDMLIDAPE